MIPPRRDAAFVASMEAILDVYALPCDPDIPLVCFDETAKELQASARPDLPATDTHSRREDYAYIRHGSAALFVSYAPHLDWRHVRVSAQRTKVDFALAMRELVDTDCPEARTIRVVLDNLNTHRPESLYHTFPAAEAHRIASRVQGCSTPKHGSWLNLAEVEIAVLMRQCLDRRIPDRDALEATIAAWVTDRNAHPDPARWPFRTTDARRRLHMLYPIPICDEQA